MPARSATASCATSTVTSPAFCGVIVAVHTLSRFASVEVSSVSAEAEPFFTVMSPSTKPSTCSPKVNVAVNAAAL